MYEELQGYRGREGFEEDGFRRDAQWHVGKLAVCGLMIALALCALIAGLVAQSLLDKLAAHYSTPATKQHMRALARNKTRLTTLAVVKLVLSLATLALASYLEYEYGRQGSDGYIQVGMDHLAGAMALLAALVDLHAIAGHRPHALLYLNVSLAVSVVTAVFCIKAVDYMMVAFVVKDFQSYFSYNQLTGVSASETAAQKLRLVLTDVCLVACLSLLFFLSVLTAVQAASSMELGYGGIAVRADKGLLMQRRCLGALHCIWGLMCAALVVLGLWNAEWSADYLGVDLLWLSLLFLATGLVSADHGRSLTTSVFVLSVLSLATALEHLAVNVNRVYQASTRQQYQQDSNIVFRGRVILGAIETGVLLAECVTALCTSVLFGCAAARLPRHTRPYSALPHICLSLGILFYGVVMTSVYVLSELGKWRYDTYLLDNSFVRIANGPVALAVVIVQLCSSCRKRLLLPGCVLEIVAGALALFVISPCVTKLYYLYSTSSDEQLLSQTLRLTDREQGYLTAAVALVAICALACIIASASAALSALRSSYLLHHKEQNSIVPANAATSKALVPFQSASNQMNMNYYWSADENPYYFHRGYYMPSYHLSPGYYGYALTTATPPSRNTLAIQTEDTNGITTDNNEYSVAYGTR